MYARKPIQWRPVVRVTLIHSRQSGEVAGSEGLEEETDRRPEELEERPRLSACEIPRENSALLTISQRKPQMSVLKIRWANERESERETITVRLGTMVEDKAMRSAGTKPLKRRSKLKVETEESGKDQHDKESHLEEKRAESNSLTDESIKSVSKDDFTSRHKAFICGERTLQDQ